MPLKMQCHGMLVSNFVKFCNFSTDHDGEICKSLMDCFDSKYGQFWHAVIARSDYLNFYVHDESGSRIVMKNNGKIVLLFKSQH